MNAYDDLLLSYLMNEMPKMYTARQERTPEFPAVNVMSNGEKMIVEAELPGVDPEKIKIHLLEDTLTLEGTRAIPTVSNVTYHRRERANGAFRKVVKLAFPVDQDKVEAQYQDGILTVTLPRMVKDKPKQIKITVA